MAQIRARASMANINAPPRSVPQGLSVEEALRYLDVVAAAFRDQPDTHRRFLSIFRDFKDNRIDTRSVMLGMGELFITSGHPELIDGFNTFLPPGYAVMRPPQRPQDVREVTVQTPRGPLVVDLRAARAP